MSEIYLDNHSATRPLPEALAAMLPFFEQRWGSTHSPHHKGEELIAPMQQSLERLLLSLGASAHDRVLFFSSYAEAIGHLFLSHYIEEMRPSGKNRILTTNTEEAALLCSLKRLEELGCHGQLLPVDAQGQLSIHTLTEAHSARASLLSLSWANGLTGVVQPIEALASICKEKGMFVHVDASYAIGKVPFSFKDLPVDFLTFDGSVIHAPKGTAALIVKEKSACAAPMTSVCVGALTALSIATKTSVERLEWMGLEGSRLRSRFERGVCQAVEGSVALYTKARRLPNCSVIAFPRIHSDALLFLLNRHHLYASLGGGHAQKLSHLLLASQIDPLLATCALSFTLSCETTEAEIDQAIATLITCTEQLRRCSRRLV